MPDHEEYSKNKEYYHEYYLKNKEKICDFSRSWRKENLDKSNAIARKYYGIHKVEINFKSREYRKSKKYKDWLKRKREDIYKKVKDWKNKNKDAVNKSNKNGRIKLRLEIIKLFGGKCWWCEYSDIRALQIDHKNGSSIYHKYRNKLNDKGEGLYRAILSGKRKIDDLQLLCANCNWIKRYENDECKRRVKFRG